MKIAARGTQKMCPATSGSRHNWSFLGRVREDLFCTKKVLPVHLSEKGFPAAFRKGTAL